MLNIIAFWSSIPNLRGNWENTKNFWHFYTSVQIDQSEHSILINYARILLKFELDLSIPIIHIQTKFHQNWTIFTQVIVRKPNCGRTDGRTDAPHTIIRPVKIFDGRIKISKNRPGQFPYPKIPARACRFTVQVR